MMCTLRRARVLIIIGCMLLMIGIVSSRYIEGLINAGRIYERPAAGVLTAVFGFLIGGALLLIGKILDLMGLHRAANNSKDMRRAFALGIVSIIAVGVMVALQLIKGPFIGRAAARAAFFLAETGVVLFAVRGIGEETGKRREIMICLLGIVSAVMSVISMQMREVTAAQAVISLLPIAMLIIASVISLGAMRGDQATGERES